MGSSAQSATPVQVEGVGGTGSLSGVTSMTSYDWGSCVTVSSSGVDCWGANTWGDLGDGTYGGGATPVQVLSP
jgi:hypothetical protein